MPSWSEPAPSGRRRRRRARTRARARRASLNSATRVVCVEVDRRGRRCRAARRRPTVARAREGLVDAAVVAVVEDEDLRRSVIWRARRIAQRLASVAVSVNDQARQPEAARQLGADPGGVLGRHHRGDPAHSHQRPRSPDGGLGRVARHRAGVAQAEVDVGRGRRGRSRGRPGAWRGRAGSRPRPGSSTSWVRRRAGARCGLLVGAALSGDGSRRRRGARGRAGSAVGRGSPAEPMHRAAAVECRVGPPPGNKVDTRLSEAVAPSAAIPPPRSRSRKAIRSRPSAVTTSQ